MDNLWGHVGDMVELTRTWGHLWGTIVLGRRGRERSGPPAASASPETKIYGGTPVESHSLLIRRMRLAVWNSDRVI